MRERGLHSGADGCLKRVQREPRDLVKELEFRSLEYEFCFGGSGIKD
jgi:hypothetical protein